MSELFNIPFHQTGISKIILDYLSEKEEFKQFYHRFPTKENYFLQAKEKLENYKNREVLVEVIHQQMSNLDLSEKQLKNLNLLADKQTVTVTTGHQLNLFTGPLYFIYKILHTVKICEDLNAEKSEFNFVPIYWMATEDHDFEEINHFNFNENKIIWNSNQSGAVGRFQLENLSEIISQFFDEIVDNRFKNELKNKWQKSFENASTLSELTRNFVHELLSYYGILILDADDEKLKKFMFTHFKNDLMYHHAEKEVNQTNEKLQEYKNQAFARVINLFYLTENGRHRIEKTGEIYSIIDTEITFSEAEILIELEENPQNFSPNVILRPLYQEVILPNVAYIGGGGELAYWLQLKSFFEKENVVFPLLVLRNSMLLMDKNQKRKAENFEIFPEKLFQSQHEFLNNWVKKNNPLFEELNDLKTKIQQIFSELEPLSKKTNSTFADMVWAQQKKQLSGFEKMNERMIKAEKKVKSQDVARYKNLMNQLFPKSNWQERHTNFSQFYVEFGDNLFKEIYLAITPFNYQFLILVLNEEQQK